MRIRRILLACGLVLSAASASAHHGWGSYDAAPLTLEGRILASTYQNPHGTLKLETPGKTWTVILAPPSRMSARGLPADMIAAGRTVAVTGYASRVVAEELRAERITVDGKTVELR